MPRVQRYWLLLGAIGGVVLAAATVVGLQFARTLTRPLSELEQTAAAVGAGDLQARAPTDSGPPEMRALAAELNETVARLDALLRSQQEFVADASHQLRTPLAALRLRLENLERDVDEEGKPSLEAALAEVNRLARLVDALLALARADASRPSPEPIDLDELVASRLDAWSDELAAREVTIDALVPARRSRPGDARLARAGARQPLLATRSTSSHPADGSRSRRAARHERWSCTSETTAPG